MKWCALALVVLRQHAVERRLPRYEELTDVQEVRLRARVPLFCGRDSLLPCLNRGRERRGRATCHKRRTYAASHSDGALVNEIALLSEEIDR